MFYECREFSVMYVDDIPIFSSNWQDHCVHIARVLGALKLYDLLSNLLNVAGGGGTWNIWDTWLGVVA